MSGLGTFLKRLQGDPLEDVADAELLGRFLGQHDASAFETLVRRHGPLVLRVCQRELPRLADAEDAFQATFLVLAQKASRIRQLETLPAWLAGVARRLARRLGQQLRRRREQLTSLASRGGPMPRHEPPAWWDEERRRLPEEYQSVIDLCLIQGLTREEAAQRLGQSPAAVHGLLYRARLKLKKNLVEHGAVAGSLLAGAPVSGAVVERLAPVLAQAAVALARDGRWPSSLLSPQAVALARAGVGAGWITAGVLAGTVSVGLLTWAGWHAWGPRGVDPENLLARATATATVSPPTPQPAAPWANPQLASGPPQQLVDQQREQSLDGPQQSGNFPQSANRPQQQARQQRSISIPVSPAARVPGPDERAALAKYLPSAAGSLDASMVTRLPHSTPLRFDNKDAWLSLITSEKEYRDSLPPPVQSVGSTANDPAWDGSRFRPDWSQELLVVVVVREPTQSTPLTALPENWIAPDTGGVGHLLLTYAGAEPLGKGAGPQRFPYVMVKVPRTGLRQVAVSIWTPPEKPAGAASLPTSK